jgi:hypothetical protein
VSTFGFDIEEFIEHRNEREFTFPLHASSIGRKQVFEVKCRRLQIMDRASLGFLPDALQNRVWEQLKQTQREIQKQQAAGAEPENIQEALSNIDGQLKLADIFCEYGWLEPKVTRTQGAEDLAGGVLHVGRFAPEDRIAYLLACNDADSEQARHFATFRQRPNDDVPGGEDREVRQDAPERRDGDTGQPVQFHTAVPGG